MSRCLPEEPHTENADGARGRAAVRIDGRDGHRVRFGQLRVECAQVLGDRIERHRVARHGARMPVPDWALLLRRTECRARDADFVVTEERR